jgi:K+-transporting ATPase A subunit
MSAASWAQFIVLAALVCATAPVIGWYMALVYGEGKKAPGDRVFLPIERAVIASFVATKSKSNAGRHTHSRSRVQVSACLRTCSSGSRGRRRST